MHVPVAIFLALQCTLCLTIRVPVVWNNDNSEVNQFAVETIPPQNADNKQKPVPIEYFQYTAQKPKFAAEIAQFHGVQSPESHYKAYPIKPHTGVAKPELGKHQILDEDNQKFRPYQEYVKKNEAIRHVIPSTTSYDIFHPYKLEEPALRELYQDPVMDKIRNDLLNSQNRLQKYENEAGEPDIKKAEYLESPEETDRKKVPHRNVPAPYEIHRPQRRPVYYRPPSVHNHRENILNQKLRHPWHQNYVKVKPIHYRPIKNNLQRLRQQHALTYDDEHNEYPQVPLPEKYSEPSEGYDIYEKGKEKFVQLRNNVDESINEAIQKNKPIVHQKLELTNDKSNENTSNEDDEDEFVPIKNYAQVRKTETTKHLPKEAAYQDADTLDEIKNAPRLREAIKSTKAQIVYSEEGYEDSAYDHAGEQKHASDHEGHGGFLKEKEQSGGKFKTPTFSAKYEDGKGSEYRDQVLDGKKWKNNNKDTEEETDTDEYSEKVQEHSDETDVYSHTPKKIKNKYDKSDSKIKNSVPEEEIERIKREETPIENSDAKIEKSEINSEHDVNKREAQIEVPEINLNTTYLSEKEILKMSKLKIKPKTENIAEKYPYYFKKLKSVSDDSPLRYAENLKLIPKKSDGGTEFYDSRSKHECPEVDDNVDPIPEKLKKNGHPDEDDENTDEDSEDDKNKGIKKDKSDFSVLEKNSRLNGLGDKIDCFKAKYFGENPLDSPFFKEDIISDPKPITVPSIDVYKLKQTKEQDLPILKLKEPIDLSKELQQKGEIDMFTLLDKLYPKNIIEIPKIQKNITVISSISPKTNLGEIQSIPHTLDTGSKSPVDSKNAQSIAYKAFQYKEDVTRLPITLRKKRAAPFVYEPYKIIKDSQIQDSKKTTTSSNISPLIKQLQSSRVATNQGNQIVKRNVSTRTYKDIGKSDREKNLGKEKGSKPVSDTSFIDVSIDQRRGEPRYELRPVNHKTEYTPVENKKSITMEDYKAQTKADKSSEDYDSSDNKKKVAREYRTTTIRPLFDVSKFLPHAEDLETKDLLGGKTKQEKNKELQSRSDTSVGNSKSEEDDEEYEDDNDDDHKITTTIKSPSRRRISTSSTTIKPEKEDDEHYEVPKLRLVTRFRDSYQTEKPRTVLLEQNESPTTKVYDSDTEITAPKYREKKKKSRKSTLVTDTKSYGEDDDDDDDEDLRKEEVDALIGVKHDTKEYMPRYEKEDQRNQRHRNGHLGSREDDTDYEERDHHHHDEEDEDEDDDDDDDEDDDDGDDDDEDEDEQTVSAETPKPDMTTTEPTKRTLARTTEIPPTTTEPQSAKLEIKPVVVKKKFESHKELPVNRSSPHITEFKQDVEEVEIIKELPSKTKKKPQKNIEALELYKDENLAKDINKLGGVEVFKEGLDLVNGPKHGGNYRIAEGLTDNAPRRSSLRRDNQKSSNDDVVASQSSSKLVEVKNEAYSRRRSDIERARKSRGRSAKLIELSDATESPTSRRMHGGNFKSIHDVRRGGRRGGSRNAKLIELDDHRSSNDQSTNTHSSDSKSYGSRGGDRHQMHGGNYRSAKIIQAVETTTEIPKPIENLNKDTSTDGKRNAAVFLNSFASAVPVLTTTPAYILDPSKRMYYYVDA